MSRQPFLHDTVVVADAPQLTVNPRCGQLEPPVAGLYQHDRRLLARLVLTIDGQRPEPLHHRLDGNGHAHFTAVRRFGDDPTPDATLVVQRVRRGGLALDETTLRNQGPLPRTLRVDLRAGTDLAAISEVKAGKDSAELDPEPTPDGLRWPSPELTVTLHADPAPERTDGDRLSWQVTLAPGASWRLALTVSVERAPDQQAPPLTAGTPTDWALPRLDCPDPRLTALVQRALTDLTGLLLAPATAPDEVFAGAGAPWYLTLFGRDALWTARLLLPVSTELAGSTLRALARHQGTEHNPRTEQAPGKIPHELRPTATVHRDSLRLPPLYYGSVDATPLFVSTLAEAWRWGLAADQVAALLPAAEAALDWLSNETAETDGGFLAYRSSNPAGLANQGWKDSGDAITHRDGRLARPPLALAEVQAYAYQAALDGADLLDAFGRPGGDRWRAWAARLRDRFRAAFWVRDAAGPYPAVALEPAGRPVDSVASNLGHLPGTGLLDPAEEALVAKRIATELTGEYGLRTLSPANPRFNPFGYHTGSIWPHDTAITALGLARAGHPGPAVELLTGLLRAAEHFDHRLPELYAGTDHAPAPYPAACHPQAWSAASAVALLQAFLGLWPDVPAGRIRLTPAPNLPFERLTVAGLAVAGHPLSVQLAAHGQTAQVLAAPPGLRISVD